MPGVGRPWFQCPEGCGRRVRHIYFAASGSGFSGLRNRIACGRCSGPLDYASRHLRRQTPGVGRVERLRRKLGDCELRPFAPLPPLKRGRSRARHEEIVAAIQAEEEKLIGHLGGIVHDLQRRIRVRKAKGQW